MVCVYRVTPVGSEFIIFECYNRYEAELYAANYTGTFTSIQVKQYFLREATKEEMENL
jgi:hypothetical protein